MSRISYRNYPVLKRTLSGSQRDTSSFRTVARVSPDVLDTLHTYFDLPYTYLNHKDLYASGGRGHSADLFSSDINDYGVLKVSESFKKAADLAKYKLEEAMFDMFHGVWSVHKGTLIYKDTVTIFHIANYKGALCYVSIFEFLRDGELKRAFYLDGRHKTNSGISIGLRSEEVDPEEPFTEVIDLEGWACNAYCNIFRLLAFKKYAQVETVESKARTKIHAQGCKYLNETDLDIEYLDSKWFTSLVNSKGFKVGGHFRLQPKKKEGEWTKELIWINDFEKKGYSRKAGILND